MSLCESQACATAFADSAVPNANMKKMGKGRKAQAPQRLYNWCKPFPRFLFDSRETRSAPDKPRGYRCRNEEAYGGHNDGRASRRVSRESREETQRRREHAD